MKLYEILNSRTYKCLSTTSETNFVNKLAK